MDATTVDDAEGCSAQFSTNAGIQSAVPVDGGGNVVSQRNEKNSATSAFTALVRAKLPPLTTLNSSRGR